MWQEAGITLDRSPIYHRAITDRHPFTHSIWDHQLTSHACRWTVGGKQSSRENVQEWPQNGPSLLAMKRQY